MPRCIASVFVEPSRPFVVACCCCRHETSAFHRVRSAARGQRSDLVCTVCVGSLDVHTIQAAALGVRFRGFVFIEAGYRVCFFSFHRSVRVLFYFAIFGLYDKRQAVARSDNCHNTTVGIITTTTTQSKQSSARVVKKRRKERRFPQKVLLPPLSLPPSGFPLLLLSVLSGLSCRLECFDFANARVSLPGPGVCVSRCVRARFSWCRSLDFIRHSLSFMFRD